MFLEQAKTLIESITTSTIRRNKRTKRDAYQGIAAVNIAKKKNVGLYNKYERQRMLYLKFKNQMERQYKSAASREARKKFR